MIVKGKYFSPPPKNYGNFSQYLKLALAEGIGLPVGRDGFPIGEWTPELLAEAISNMEANNIGVDSRSIHHWLQDNDRVASAVNIKWISRVLGCNDPEKAALWTKELTAARARTIATRKKGKVRPIAGGSAKTTESNKKQSGIALRSEGMFSGQAPLNLVITIWAGLALLWILSNLIGTQSITYSPIEGLVKQVGFNTNPAWIIAEPVFIPLILILVSQLIRYWRRQGRQMLDTTIEHDDQISAWEKSVSSFRGTYWLILLFCFLMVFAVQWTTAYLVPFLKGTTELHMVDWLTVSLVRPNIVSVPQALVVSMLGFLYTSFVYWLYFVALLLLYTVATDYARICRSQNNKIDEVRQRVVRNTGVKILNTTYRCAIAGVLIALCIKLNATYLITDSEHIVDWLLRDATYALTGHDEGWKYIDGSPSPFLTSFILAFITVFVFLCCAYVIITTIERVLTAPEQRARLRKSFLVMLCILSLLSVTFLLIGQFYGFSILLIVTIGVLIIEPLSAARLTGAYSKED